MKQTAAKTATTPEASGDRTASRVDLRTKGFTETDLETSLGRMTVYEAGNGPPLLFLHSISGGASSYEWYKIAPHFSDRYRVIAADLIGWGASDHLDRFVTFGDYTTMIGDLLCNITERGKPPIVIAQSLTAGFAAAVANAQPHLVERLVLITPSGARDFGVDQFTWLVRATLGALSNTAGLNLAVYRAVFHRRRTLLDFWKGPGGFENPQEVDADLVDASWWSACRPNAAYSALPFIGGSLRYDAAPILRELCLPTFAIWGSEEEFLDEDIKVRLQTVNPRIRHTTVTLRRGNLVIGAAKRTMGAIETALKEVPTHTSEP